MDYFCSNCKQKYGFDVEVKYCPFCGKPYRAEDPQAKADTLRIVIGSDSERTIENKYWDASRKCLSGLREKIQSRLQELKEEVFQRVSYIPIPEEFGAFISAGKSEQSVTIRRYIKKIERILEETEKNPDQFVMRATQAQDLINQERIIIADTYKKITGILGFEEQIDLENLKSSEGDEDFYDDYIRLNRYDHSKYRRLLQAIYDSEEKIQTIIIDDVSSFNIPYAKSLPKYEAEKYDPDTLSGELAELAEGDYDFIFGESPDQFVLKFWDCIIYLAHIANEMLDDLYMKACTPIDIKRYKGKTDSKIKALTDAVSDFSEKLDIHLDKLYRSQSADMLEVQQSLAKMMKECIADGNL